MNDALSKKIDYLDLNRCFPTSFNIKHQTLEIEIVRYSVLKQKRKIIIIRILKVRLT